MKRPITLDDIAHAAGVSRTTVSQVLTGGGRASEATRKRVKDIARELDYSVNIGARNLRKATAGAIGLYIPERTTSLAYYMDFTFGVVERAQQNGIAITLIVGGSTAAVKAAHVDGFVIVDPPEEDETVRRILAGHHPVVTGERVPQGFTEPDATVYSDHRLGMTKILRHLVERGAVRPALIMPGVHTAWSIDIHDAYQDWCQENDLQPLIEYSKQRLYADDVRRVTEGLLQGRDTPDAIISAPDGSALGAVSAARAHGLQVGSDILITGYADSLGLALCDPPVTAIDLRPRAFGYRCVDRLIGILEPDTNQPLTAASQSPEEHAIELHIRASTAGLRSDR